MSVTVSWSDQDRRMVHCSVQGTWTNEDDAYANTQVRNLFSGLNRKAHVLIDFRHSHSLRWEVLRRSLDSSRDSALFQHPNAGFLIFLKAPFDIQSMIVSFASLDPHMAKRVKFVDDLEQAYALT